MKYIEAQCVQYKIIINLKYYSKLFRFDFKTCNNAEKTNFTNTIVIAIKFASKILISFAKSSLDLVNDVRILGANFINIKD